VAFRKEDKIIERSRNYRLEKLADKFKWRSRLRYFIIVICNMIAESMIQVEFSYLNLNCDFY